MSERRLSRRQFLSAAAAGAGGLMLYMGARNTQSLTSSHTNLAVAQAGGIRAKVVSPAVKKFDVALPMPSVLQPTRRDATSDYYELEVKQVRQEILPGKMTTLNTYNGVFPGMTFEAQRGRKSVVHVTNNILEPISCHYHGGVTAPQHDGYAEDITVNGVKMPTLIRPGGEWTYEYPNEQPAATNWFHDHAIHHTAEHVYRGMAAFYLVRDQEEASFNLPKGPYEIPLVFMDRLFDNSGELIYDNSGHEGVEGDVQLMNGAPWPRLKVAARKYRFRMLNGCNWRRYDLSFTNNLPFIQIGTESGFLRAPVSHQMIRMFPGERNDVVVDFSKVPVGTTFYLQNKAEEAVGTPMQRMMAIEVTHREADDSQVPAVLSSYPDLTTNAVVKSAVKTRQFRFDRSNGYYTINGNIWDVNRFDANPRLGTTEIWHLENSSGGWFHPIHIHLINFQILRRKVKGKWRLPHPWERGRKDVASLPENEEVQVVINWDPHEFQNFTGAYMMHCHNVDHEDYDMMTQFNLLPQA